MKKLLTACALSIAIVAAVPAAAQIAYTNGPVNGQVNGWNINFGLGTTDSFTLAQTTTITGFDFGGWTFAGDIATAVDYGFSSSADFAITGTAALSAGDLIPGAGFDYYDVRTYSASIAPITLAAGTYWFSLQNAVTAQGNAAYWDENDGPSSAALSGYGARASESFTLYANGAVPEPASWALMLGGFGMVGGAMRSRRKGAVSFA
jgi:hypothetical protein